MNFTSQYYFMITNMLVSTETSLASFTDKIKSAIDSSKFSVGVFIDFSKAFYTISHGIFLRKLFAVVKVALQIMPTPVAQVLASS